MKKLSILLIALLACSMLFANGSKEAAKPAEAAPAPAVVTPVTGKTIKIGCSATFVPYESITMDAKGNKVNVGMNIEILTKLIESLGGKAEFYDMPFKTLIGAIQAGQIDFCSGGMTPTAKRWETLDFTEIFFYPHNAIVYRDTDYYPTLDSLAGKTVCYPFGTNLQNTAEKVPDVKAVGIQGSPACVEEVKSKRADAAIIDGAGAAEFLKQNKGLKMSLLEKIVDDAMSLGFPKNSPYYECINNKLKEMMADGTIDQIVAKYLSPEFIN